MRKRGFTLFELMVAVGLMALLVRYVFYSVNVQSRTYVVVDQVAEAKQNVRVVADLIEREIRNSGYMVPRTAAVCGVDSTNGADKLYLSDWGAIVSLRTAVDAEAAAFSKKLGASPQVGPAGVGDDDQTLLFATPADLNIDSAGNAIDFAVNAGVILADRNEAVTGVACGTVTAIGANSVTTEMEDSTGGLDSGSDLVAIPAIVYELVGTTLMRNNVPLVQQVEDFQVSYFFDLNGDSNVDAGEYIADGVGAGDDYEANNLDHTLIREVRINIVIRTRDADPDPTWSGGIGQATENRDPGTVAPNDGVRRRVHSSTVRLRAT